MAATIEAETSAAAAGALASQASDEDALQLSANAIAGVLGAALAGATSETAAGSSDGPDSSVILEARREIERELRLTNDGAVAKAVAAAKVPCGASSRGARFAVRACAHECAQGARSMSIRTVSVSSAVSIADEYSPPADLDPAAIGDEELEEAENEPDKEEGSASEQTPSNAAPAQGALDTPSAAPQYPTIFLLPSRSEYWQLCRPSYEEHERIILQARRARGVHAVPRVGGADAAPRRVCRTLAGRSRSWTPSGRRAGRASCGCCA